MPGRRGLEYLRRVGVPWESQQDQNFRKKRKRGATCPAVQNGEEQNGDKQNGEEQNGEGQNGDVLRCAPTCGMVTSSQICIPHGKYIESQYAIFHYPNPTLILTITNPNHY